MLMSWQTDGPLKYQPSCMRTRMEKNCWTSVETRKRMAYNPWAHTDAQHTGRMRTHRERKKEKKTVSKVDMMGVGHPSIVDRFQRPPIFPYSSALCTSEKRKLTFAIAGKTSATSSIIRYFPTWTFIALIYDLIHHARDGDDPLPTAATHGHTKPEIIKTSIDLWNSFLSFPTVKSRRRTKAATIQITQYSNSQR